MYAKIKRVRGKRGKDDSHTLTLSGLTGHHVWALLIALEGGLPQSSRGDLHDEICAAVATDPQLAHEVVK